MDVAADQAMLKKHAGLLSSTFRDNWQLLRGIERRWPSGGWEGVKKERALGAYRGFALSSLSCCSLAVWAALTTLIVVVK